MSKPIPYWQKLQNPKWQKLRLEVFERDGFMCRYCGSSEKTLEVHHEYYVSRREPWEYPKSAFLTLCSECHRTASEDSQIYRQDWEYFIEISRHEGCDSSGFISALQKCRINTGEPESEVLYVLTNALAFGLINKETIMQLRREIIALEMEHSIGGNDVCKNI